MQLKIITFVYLPELNPFRTNQCRASPLSAAARRQGHIQPAVVRPTAIGDKKSYSGPVLG